MDNDEFFASLRALIDAWCDRRCLNALQHVLGPYLAFSGMTDSWGDLRNGLQSVRAFAKHELQPDEVARIGGMIVAADHLLRGERQR